MRDVSAEDRLFDRLPSSNIALEYCYVILVGTSKYMVYAYGVEDALAKFRLKYPNAEPVKSINREPDFYGVVE